MVSFKPLIISDDIEDFGDREIDPSTELIASKGLDIAGLGTYEISNDASGNMIFTDPTAGGPWTLEQLLKDTRASILSYSFFSSSGTPYLETSNSSYQAGAEIIWEGTDNVGPISSITLLAGSASTTKQASFRILDLDSGLIIAEVSTISLDRELISMGTISNVSTTPARWEVQLRKDDNGAKAQLSALLIVTDGVV